ncbi:MAG: hypothetical protein IK031_00865 [Bacteroidales bacterium]|nr:hypothetical protein [Bacteroidales bacterium]
MKKLFLLAASALALFCLSSCDKLPAASGSLDLEGTWGLTKYEILSKINGEVTESYTMTCDPYNPVGNGELKIQFVKTEGNVFQVTMYNWNKFSGSWVATDSMLWEIKGNKVYATVAGYESALMYESIIVSGGKLTLESNVEGEMDGSLYGMSGKVKVLEHSKLFLEKMAE